VNVISVRIESLEVREFLNRIVSVKHNFVCSLIIVELATCFDPAGSSSGLYVNQVMLENYVHLWDPIDVYKR
jgi:hypothetical protein